MRQLALDVVIGTADQKKVRYLADLARLEVWTGRHPFRLGELLSNPNKARTFLAHFILKREGAAILRPEFQPQAIRGSMRNNNSDAGRKTECSNRGETPRPQPVSQVPQPAQTQYVILPPPGSELRDPNSPQLIPDEQVLLDVLVSWMTNEVHPGHWEDVAKETNRQPLDYSDYYRTPVTSPVTAEIIEQCKPIFEASDAFGLINFYSEWAAKWCLALNSDACVVCSLMGAVPRCGA
jgi:hypothetical protein